MGRVVEKILEWTITVLQVACGAYLATYPMFAQPQKIGESTPFTFKLFLCSAILAAILPVIEKIRSSRKDKNTEFYKALVQSLPDSIRLLGNRGTLTASNLRDVQRALLTEICKVFAHHGQKDKRLINANIMRRFPVDKFVRNGKFTEEVKFVDPSKQPNEYAGVLQITVWAHTPSASVTEEFALPIARLQKSSLFGAPMACDHTSFHIVSDLGNKKELNGLLKDMPMEVQREVVQHFHEQESSMKSFLSHRLDRNGKRLGVVNVQCDYPNIIGKKLDYLEHELSLCLAPLFELLAVTVEQEIEIEKRKIVVPGRAANAITS